MTQPKTETDELIEMMVDVCLHQPNFISEIPRYKKQKEELEPMAKEMLSVIRNNVHMVSRTCDNCGGGRLFRDCPTCKGHGVVPVDKERE